MKWFRAVLALLPVLAVLWFAGRMIFPVPDVSGRDIEAALAPDGSMALGAQSARLSAAHPGQSGVAPLASGHAALRSRLVLADSAQGSIDAMYYIWHEDVSGTLLLDALRRAAERGVRVRLLLDDNGIAGLDQTLAALNAMPNFSVRLFNPSTVRKPKMLGYALYPLRMNRRMHNKAFIVDGAAAIVGGRNIGDEYFALGDAPAYLDLDVLGTGEVVADTVAVFDEYWNSEPVLALEQVIPGEGDLSGFEAALQAAREDILAGPGADPVAAEQFGRGELVLDWTDVQVVADDPAKGMGQITRDQLMITRRGQILGMIDSNLDLISAYFVPGKAGAAFFSRLAQEGREVRILTNSWEATDVPMVHAGYVKYRRELLEAGVKLYELRPDKDGPRPAQGPGPFGSSESSLHAKTFAVDDARVFIGSFNFDPRSALLNCEMGFLIDSPEIAAAGTEALTNKLITRSYQPVLEGGDMVWRSSGTDGPLDREPGLGFLDRIKVYVLNLLPIEWLL
ncbi:phospholipase D-like domain-containing protein [Paracoccus marinaquae]|uniref:Phospholipase D n=1 Tax=Paracoccus marinaquae TaxID=2841926 RepID=A0ABS6AJZ2_9RHOB|nr:phospholipase D family protein [Paracoccus marinaquae]MBU3030916.1 phospholipase D family protein [Paracoccus marinaquae]